MRRIFLVAAFTLALQFTAFVSTSWFFGQSTGQNAISTVFGQEAPSAPAEVQVSQAPAEAPVGQAPVPGPAPVVGVGAYAGTAFTIDICEGDIYRKVGIGG